MTSKDVPSVATWGSREATSTSTITLSVPPSGGNGVVLSSVDGVPQAARARTITAASKIAQSFFVDFISFLLSQHLLFFGVLFAWEKQKCAIYTIYNTTSYSLSQLVCEISWSSNCKTKLRIQRS
jgi:hypothetical protein